MGSDLLALLGSVLVASEMVGAFLTVDPSWPLGLYLALAPGLILVKGGMGLYPAIGIHPMAELVKSVRATAFLVSSFFLASLLWGADAASQWILVIAGFATMGAAPVMRSLTRKGLSRLPGWSQPLLIFGTGPAAQRLSVHYRENPGLGLSPVLVRHDLSGEGADVQPLVRELASQYGAVCAAVPLEGAYEDRPADLLRECANTFPHLLVIPPVKGPLGSLRECADVGEVPGIRAGKSLLLPVPRGIKRAVDATLALLIGLACLPLCILIAIAIKLTSEGPVFFGQARIGANRRPFVAWKFRSMYANAGPLLEEHLASNPELQDEWARDHKLKDDPRLTSVGRLLRRTSLDELPQLWNVLRGEMSLVGPRPIVEDEIRKYGAEFERYMTVPPGLTGLWQVSGRNNTTYDERIRLDAFYAENWSLTLDAYILGRTVKTVLTGEGAY